VQVAPVPTPAEIVQSTAVPISVPAPVPVEPVQASIASTPSPEPVQVQAPVPDLTPSQAVDETLQSAPEAKPVLAGELQPDLLCSLCNGPVTAYKVNDGVYVRCENPCDPQCHENPFGFGSNAKSAHYVLTEKYKKQQ
jgi:hypothetical protein